MPISHGKNESGTYNSAAFFIRHDSSQNECLFFGDVEPDSIALKPMSHFVWREAAPKIISGKLNAVFLECSWPSGRDDATLFGHLTPEHFTQELRVLATEVVGAKVGRNSTNTAANVNGQVRKLRRPSIASILTRKNKRESTAPTVKESAVVQDLRGALAGVQVFVIHCKDDLEEKYSEPINQVIASQIRDLVEKAGLGCEIIFIEQGTRICMFALVLGYPALISIS